jgi:hypothetical protein
MLGAGRREQHDRRRVRVDGLAILDEREVVDARAFERDRALQRGVSIAMRGAGGEHRGAGLHVAGRRGGAGRLRGRPGGAAPGAGGAGCGAVPVRRGRAGAGACCLLACCCCSASWRCFSICGMPMKYCQPISTIADSTMAMMVFFVVHVGAFSRRPRAVRVSAPGTRLIRSNGIASAARRRSARSHVPFSARKRGIAAHDLAQPPPHPVALDRRCRPSSIP